MNKVKMFFIAAALVLTTAGVFAGKAKFIAFPLYASSTTTLSSTSYQVSQSQASLIGLSAAAGTQVQITSSNGTPYGLYYYDPSTDLKPLTSNGW